MVPPPKKPMPEKLRDALNKQRGPYAPEPAALAYAKPEDPHSAERKMLEQILNGCADVPSFDASPRPDPQASNDLMAQMAGRLGKLEASLRHLRDEAAAKDEALSRLRDEVARLRARDGDEDELYEENDALRARLREMEKFLSDYGLVWVGGDATRPTREETPADEPPRSPTRPAAPRVDTARLVEALRVLNARVLGDRPQVHVEGTRARFKLKDGERVAVYADGLLINGGPFRPYGSPTCRAFVDDVLDGYFPAEFKDRYPDGVPFDVKDVATEQYASYGEAFGGAGRATGRPVRTLADVGDRDIAPVAPEALLAKHLAGLCARVVELTGLTDHDRPGAQDEDRGQVVTAWHACRLACRWGGRRCAVAGVRGAGVTVAVGARQASWLTSSEPTSIRTTSSMLTRTHPVWMVAWPATVYSASVIGTYLTLPRFRRSETRRW